MYYNPNLVPTIFLTIVFFVLGFKAQDVIRKQSVWLQITAGTILLVASFPGLSMIGYYTHMINTPLWYYNFRAIPFVEILCALIGLPAGCLVHRMSSSFPQFRTLFRMFGMILTLGLVYIPFAKPILLPVGVLGSLDESTWVDGVCLQSVPSSCGPASLATLMNFQGINVTEKELARAAFTAATGTENWYLARVARQYGFSVEYATVESLDDVPVPAIIGVMTSGGFGHFVAAIERTEDGILIGDPLTGAYEVTANDYKQKFASFTGFVMTVRQVDNLIQEKK